MSRLLLLLSILIFTACDGKITTNSAVDSIMGDPQGGRNYTFTFVDDKLRDFNTSSQTQTVNSLVHYIDDRHIDIEEVIYNKELQTKETSVRHFLYDTKGKLISVSVLDPETQKYIIFDYLYNKKGFLTRRTSNDHSADLTYKLDRNGKITKETYLDKSGFNIFIYEKDKIKAIKFHDDKNIYYGSMTFKQAISLETLLMLE